MQSYKIEKKSPSSSKFSKLSYQRVVNVKKGDKITTISDRMLQIGEFEYVNEKSGLELGFFKRRDIENIT